MSQCADIFTDLSVQEVVGKSGRTENDDEQEKDRDEHPKERQGAEGEPAKTLGHGASGVVADQTPIETSTACSVTRASWSLDAST